MFRLHGPAPPGLPSFTSVMLGKARTHERRRARGLHDRQHDAGAGGWRRRAAPASACTRDHRQWRNLDRLVSGRPLKSVNFGLLVPVREELGITLGDPFVAVSVD